MFMIIAAWLSIALGGSLSYLGESCDRTADCWGHLRCVEKACVPPPNPPDEEKCGTPGYKFTDLSGKVIYSCPPDCGFENSELFGPICYNKIPDCPNLDTCFKEGLCTYNPAVKRCVATELGCISSTACAEQGICGYEPKKQICVASAQGCGNAEIGCKEQGHCGFDGRRCVGSVDGCANNYIACGFHGLCGFDGLNCVASEEGCARSGVSCGVKGLCGFDEREVRCLADR